MMVGTYFSERKGKTMTDTIQKRNRLSARNTRQNDGRLQGIAALPLHQRRSGLCGRCQSLRRLDCHSSERRSASTTAKRLPPRGCRWFMGNGSKRADRTSPPCSSTRIMMCSRLIRFPCGCPNPSRASSAMRKMFARGASDNKAGVWGNLKTFEALLRCERRIAGQHQDHV